MRILDLPDMLRKYDIEPVLVAGWETRGKEFPTPPLGALRHWTAGSLRQGIPSLNILTYGRSDLPGPLCQVGQERGPGTREDLAYVIASGKANHAGDGNLNGIRGNYKLLGLEIEWAPQFNEGFSDRRRDVSERIMAALSECCSNWSWGDAGEHREYALPAGRKIDTNLPGDMLRDRIMALRSQQGDLDMNAEELKQIVTEIVDTQLKALEQRIGITPETGGKGLNLSAEMDLLRKQNREIALKVGATIVDK